MIKTRPYDPTRYFHDDEDIAVYLQVALQESIADNDYSLLAHAIETSAKARGMTALANAAGIPRNELYDLLEADAPMPFATLHKLLAALGVQVSLTPVPAQNRPRQKNPGAGRSLIHTINKDTP